MSCSNKVLYLIPSGYDYREVNIICGNTDPQGNRAICNTCAGNKKKMEEIKRQELIIREDNVWARSAGWGEF